MAQHRSLAYHPTAHPYPGGGDRGYTSPDDDLRAGREEKKPRKRNSVACARCRKRKIKCTGDLHDGNGCEACQQAGTNQTHCFYLRVNSHQLDEFPLQPAPESEWPYSAPVSTAYPPTAPRITSDPSQYALANGAMLPPSTAAPYPGQVSTRGPNDMASGSYGPATQSRPFVSPGYHTGMDPMSPQYNSQLPRHGMPLQVSQALTANYSATEPSQHWTPLPTISRQLPSNYSFDTDACSNYPSSGFPYLPTSGVSYPNGSIEASSVFPGLSPLAANLPYNGTNRTLPNPVSIQSSIQGSSGSPQEHDVGLGPFQQHLDKPNDSWDFGVGTSRSSVSSAAQDTLSVSGPASSTSSSSPSDGHGGLNNGYDNFPYSSQVGSDASASSARSGGISRRMSDEDGFQATASGILSNPSRRRQFSNLQSPYDGQGMHSGFGMQGSPIHHPQPHYSAARDMPPILRGPMKVKAHEPRRPAMSNTRGSKAHVQQ